MNGKIFRTVIRLCKEYWLAITVLLVLEVGQTFVGNYTFVLFQRLIDSITAAQPLAGSLASLSPLLAWYIGTNLLNHLLVYLEGVPRTTLDKSLVQWVKLRALEKIARIDYLAYQNLGTGNLIQVIENGAEATRKILTGFYLGFPRGLAQMVIGLYFIGYYDRTLFFVVLAGFGVFFLVANTLMRYLRGVLERMLANQESFSNFTVRAFMELVVFRVNNRFKAEYERVKGISDEIVRARAQVYLVQELAYTGIAVLIFLVEAFIVIEQAGKIIHGASTVGTLVALVSFIRIVFWPVIGFGQSWMEYKMDSVAFERFDRFLSLPDDPGLERKVGLAIERGKIVFQNVTFAYQDQEVICDFSLTLEGGRTTAFVGASGSGKSTLVRLLLHLLKPEEGRVLVDGQDLAAVNLGSYYQEIAYIPQEPPIFDGTLRENLTLDRPVSAERLNSVIRQVGLEELVRKLPKGAETLVGERGIKLSGGERQRLAFGRVLLQDPKIVILDEPTASLDSLTEDFVTRNLATYLQGRTVIIVAHRLQTVTHADQIVVLENGRIAQQGQFEDLVSAEGKFRQLWEKQIKEHAG